MINTIPINLAVEDELSEHVARRVLSTRSVAYIIRAVYSQNGFGYLKKRTSAFNKAANICPFLMLTDLDRYPCPPQLIKEWLKFPKHPHFLLRVAVQEIESWLLSDSKGLGNFLGLRKIVSYENPEKIGDPKQELLRTAIASPKRFIRESLVWKEDSGQLFQGPDYNGTLARFVVKEWDIDIAAKKCSSLCRLFRALDRIENEMSKKDPSK
jgi:hypothetical protein